jgi:hypothetical protein
MNILIYITGIIAALKITFMVTSSWKSNLDYKPQDARRVYMEDTLPHLSTSREELLREYKECENHIDKMYALSKTLDKSEAKDMVYAKMKQLGNQLRDLRIQIDRIDSQVEQGVAMKEFNFIEGGGQRLTDLKQVLKESETRIQSTERINKGIRQAYNN